MVQLAFRELGSKYVNPCSVFPLASPSFLLASAPLPCFLAGVGQFPSDVWLAGDPASVIRGCSRLSLTAHPAGSLPEVTRAAMRSEN